MQQEALRLLSEAAATALECSALVPDDNRPRIINCDPWSIVTKLPLSNNESMHSYGLTNPTPSLLFQLLTRNSINARCTSLHTKHISVQTTRLHVAYSPLPTFILLTPWT